MPDLPDIKAEEIIYFLMNPDFSSWLFALKIVFIGAGVAFIVGIIIILFRTEWMKRLIIQDVVEFSTYKMMGARKLVKNWEKITDRLKTANEGEYKLAVIEADHIFEDILKRLGYAGETFGDKLKSAGPTLVPNMDEINEVHQIRDKIVYDPDYRLELDEAKKILQVYEEGLRNLYAI